MINRSNIQELPFFSQLEIWLDYQERQFNLRSSYHTRDISLVEIYDKKTKETRLERPSDKGWGKPDWTYLDMEIRYLWRDQQPLSFKEFTTPHTKPYQEGYLPMWEHYWRFRDEIQL